MKLWRVSSVECFRRYEQDEEYDLDSLLQQLRGEATPSTAMSAGSALHKALETAPSSLAVDVIEQEYDGVLYKFRFTGDFEITLPDVRELRASKTWFVDDDPITITGQVDAIEGARIDDHKTTSRFDPERYIEGFQWRLYLSIFGARHFRWNVFEMAWNDDEQLYDVFALHRLEQFRYPAMEDDCKALVERFARFVRQWVPVAEAA